MVIRVSIRFSVVQETGIPMDIDLPDNAGDLLRSALGFIDNFIWLIVVGAGFLLSRFRSKQPESTPAPASGDAWSGGYRVRAPIDANTQPGFGSTFSTPVSDRSSSDDPLQYGSIFDQQDDQQRDGQRDEPREATKWGFDEGEWSSSFGPKRSSEPTITKG